MEITNNKNPNRETIIKVHQQIPRNIDEYLIKYGRFFPFGMEVMVIPSSGVLNNLTEPKVGRIVGMDILANKFFVSIELMPIDREYGTNYIESLYHYNTFCQKSIISYGGAQRIIEAHVTDVLPILYPLSVMNNVLLEKGMFSFKPAYLFLEALDIIPKEDIVHIPFERSDVHFINHDDKVYQISYNGTNIFLTNYECWKIRIINDKINNGGFSEVSFNVWERVISFFNTHQIDYVNFIDNCMAINKFDIIDNQK